MSDACAANFRLCSTVRQFSKTAFVTIPVHVLEFPIYIRSPFSEGEDVASGKFSSDWPCKLLCMTGTIMMLRDFRRVQSYGQNEGYTKFRFVQSGFLNVV